MTDQHDKNWRPALKPGIFFQPRQIFSFFAVLFCLSLAANTNFLRNTDLSSGQAGFSTVKTMHPVGHEASVIRHVQQSPAAGGPALHLGLSKETALGAILIQQLKLQQIREAGVYRLRCKVLFAGFDPALEEGGSLHIRLRQWSQGKHLKNSANMWLPFNGKDGLGIYLQEQVSRAPGKRMQDFQDLWLEFSSSGILDATCSNVDLMISCSSKNNIDIYIRDLELCAEETAPLKVLRKPLSILQNSSSLPLELELAEDESAEKVVLQARFYQGGKLCAEQSLTLPPGRQSLSLELSKSLDQNQPLKVELQAGTQSLSFQLDWEEDPFAF